MGRSVHMDVRRSAKVCGAASLAVLAGCFFSGCSDIGSSMSDIGSGITDLDASIRAPRVDLVAEGKVKAQVVSGTQIAVSLPSIHGKRNEMQIAGTVTRRPGFDGPIPGFLDVQIRSQDGQLIDQSLIHWAPENIPTTGKRSAEYGARILGIPAPGSIVRIAYVEKLADLDTPLGPPETGGVSGGSGHNGGGHSAFGGGSHR